MFNSNIRAGTIAHRLDDVRVIFRDKVKFVYDNLPEVLKLACPIIRDSADELVFANNSSIRVSTSMRSGTLQYLHISEYGQLYARYPEKAREIRTGALNTVQAGQVVFIESTAAGKEGHFFDLCEQAQSKQRMGTPLTPLDFKFHFFPWWRCPDYEIDPAVSAATTGVANATARLRATIEAMIFIPRHRRLGLFSLAGTGRALCFNASLNVRGRWCLASKSVNASSASCCKLLPLSLESSSSACKVSGSKPISLRAMKHYSRNGRAPTEADQEEAPAWGGPGLGFLE